MSQAAKWQAGLDTSIGMRAFASCCEKQQALDVGFDKVTGALQLGDGLCRR
jgi:hypothetical protein